MQTKADSQMIECEMGPHYNVMDTPILVGQSYFSDEDKHIMPVYEADGVKGKWSTARDNPNSTPPTIGAHIKINFNELGFGVVTGYFFESGWMGVYVRLEKEPAWRKKKASAGKDAMVFGSEITIL